MLPVIIIAVIAIPLILIAFRNVRRNAHEEEHPVTETDADRARTEHEFEDAERYQAEWREQTHDDLREERLP